MMGQVLWVSPEDHRVVTYRPEEQMKLYYMGNSGMCSDILCSQGVLPGCLWRDNITFSFDRLRAITELNHRPEDLPLPGWGPAITSIWDHKYCPCRKILFCFMCLETCRVTGKVVPCPDNVTFCFDAWSARAYFSWNSLANFHSYLNISNPRASLISHGS